MDGVSAAASIVAIVETSGQVFDLCRKYYSEVRNAREDIRRLRDEVMSLQDVLTNVADLVDVPGSARLPILDRLNRPEGPIEQCRNELNGLVAKLDTEEMRSRALMWPFNKKDISKAISVIRRQKDIFNLALTADMT
jgi:hypothetical protein